MTTDPTIREQGYQYFLQEAPELLQVLEQGLLTLQEDSSINKVNTLMRATHTLKGAAASLELETIAKVAHSLEDVFRALCRPEVFIDAEVEALLFEGFECLRLTLRAELSEATVNEDEILNRTATIFAQLQDALGDCFDQDAPLPTSAELGFDVTQSIFEVGVDQRLDQLRAVLETEQPQAILPVLQTQAEVFLGLGESLNLPGFEAIAHAAIAALEHHPDHVTAIAQLALKDFQAGQKAILAGDRDEGGQPSKALQALAQIQEHEQIAAYLPDNSAATFTAATLADETNVLPADVDEFGLDEFGLSESDVEAIAHPLENTATLEEIILSASASDEVAVDSLENTTAILEETAASNSDSNEVTIYASGSTTAITETTAGVEGTPASEQPATGEATNRPGIHKLFQWMRKSVSGSMNESSMVDSPAPPEAATEPEPRNAATVAASANTSSNSADITAGTKLNADESDALFSHQSLDDEDTNTLLEDIWGGSADPADAIDTVHDSDADQSSGAISVSSDAIAPNFRSKSTPDFEVLHPTDVSKPLNSQQSVQQPTPLLNKGLMPSAPTVRIQIEHLDQLNYAVGELLTNHNQQSLQAEQIQSAMRHLYVRLRQHQQLLSQLQDWVDYQPELHEPSKNGGWPIAASSPSASPSFQSKFLGLNQPPQALHAFPNGFDVLELEQYSEPQLVIQSLLDDTVQLTEAIDAVEMFTRQSRQTQEKQGRLLLKTRDALIEGRMFPLGQLFERFPRVLQQLETLHHKPVELTLHGTEVLVDKAIGEKLYDPLLHLVRNAFDHGIEPVAVRQQQAKPKAGQLEITAYHQGKHLVIEVRDDGQGLDFERIRQRAIERQLVSPEQARLLSEAQLTDLLFEPGFSTASQISSLSGRGVGLDVVRSQLQALQGEVAVTSVAHQGTTFTLHIPLSLTIAKLLVCQAADRTYALLPDAIEQIIIPKTDQIQQREHCRALWWGAGQEACLIPIYALSELLDYHEQVQHLPTQSATPFMDRASAPHILLIRHEGVLLGVEVDQMMGEQELVIRPLNALLTTHAYIYGASILADGRLTLVLDGATLAEAAANRQSDNQTVYSSPHLAAEMLIAPAQSQQPSTPSDLEPGMKRGQKLLVVDDSITTRQTLTLTLQKAGYQIVQAQDGQEAVDQLLQQPSIQLVICDIEMPRMNGFEFLQHCQHDSGLTGVPVMMLSSRSSEKHRLLAEQLGAIAYISKPYLEHRLLEMVAEVLKADVLNPISG